MRAGGIANGMRITDCDVEGRFARLFYTLRRRSLP